MSAPLLIAGGVIAVLGIKHMSKGSGFCSKAWWTTVTFVGIWVTMRGITG